MSAPTFKVGDLVMTPTWGVATVVQVDEDDEVEVRFDPDGDITSWTMWYHADALTLAPTPMSPEARMVWHAMRAGAKRTDRYHQTSLGTTWRIHRYSGSNMSLWIEIALTPRAEDEAGR